MASGFDDLSEQQKREYRDVLARLGCREHQGELKASREGPIHISSDPARSAIVPHFVRVDDLDLLKDLVGLSDALFADGTLAAPACAPEQEWPAERAVESRRSLTAEELGRIIDAGRAYVQGPSAKVASYKRAVEKLFLPLFVATFSAPDVSVTPDHPLVISTSDPSVINFGTITIVEGGQIFVQRDVKIIAQVLKKVPVDK
jgi:hypothetical protein